MLWRRRTFLLASILTLVLFLWRDSLFIPISKHQEYDMDDVTFTWTGPENPHPIHNDSARFLAYLPHSGFHNQRIEFENAIVLSILLNRTLVLPLARLGENPLPYKPFDELFEKYGLSDKSWLSHCYSEDTAANSTVKECRKFERYTHLSWQDIVDVSRLTSLGVTFVERWNFRRTWFRDILQLDPSDIYWLKDSSAYEVQFCDVAKSEAQKGKYERRVSLLELEEDTNMYRLLHLGTLFGSSRLRLSTQEHQSIRLRVREAMSLANPYLNRLADKVVTMLGGRDTYFSVHIRAGDGLFAENAVQNSLVVWSTLLHSIVGLSEDAISELHSAVPFIPQLLSNQTPSVVPLQSPRFELCTRNRNSSALATPLFIATDARNPHTHPALQIFLSTFPCIFFISDFPWAARELAHLVNPLDNSPMDRFFISFLDALVASRGATVVGTPESTFSIYIEEVLWPQYHK
jgi:hypothetical protein